MSEKSKRGIKPNLERIARALAVERLQGIKPAAKSLGIAQSQLTRWKKAYKDDPEMVVSVDREYRVLEGDWRKALAQAGVRAADTLYDVIKECTELIAESRAQGDLEMALALLNLKKSTANDLFEHLVPAAAVAPPSE